MNFERLNAAGFQFNSVFYQAEFEDILCKIIACYKLMICDSISLSNDENLIRDVLYLNYLNNNEIRLKVGLKHFYFDREIPEDKTRGRTDLRILSHYSFEDTSAYYVIECKRLNNVNTSGVTGFNAKYIEDGICRFTSLTYSSYYKTNGMMGFVVQSMDIHQNVAAINGLLNSSFSSANTNRALYAKQLLAGFNFSYCSTHRVDNEKVTIYHLMFDVSSKIA